MSATRVYLSLGSNLGDRLALLRAAVQRLRELGPLVATSRLYESEPWEDEPGRTSAERRAYLNCVVVLDTTLAPRDVLARVHAIEDALGRERPPGLTPEARRFVARTVDIDILFYGDAVISAPDDLQVPHLLAAERAFVLHPLAEVAPDLVHPVLYRRVRDLLEDLADEHEVRVWDHPPGWADA